MSHLCRRLVQQVSLVVSLSLRQALWRCLIWALSLSLSLLVSLQKDRNQTHPKEEENQRHRKRKDRSDIGQNQIDKKRGRGEEGGRREGGIQRERDRSLTGQNALRDR
ncbi:hypothetical protein FKM82_031297 [Ascaphus truei]